MPFPTASSHRRRLKKRVRILIPAAIPFNSQNISVKAGLLRHEDALSCISL